MAARLKLLRSFPVLEEPNAAPLPPVVLKPPVPPWLRLPPPFNVNRGKQLAAGFQHHVLRLAICCLELPQRLVAYIDFAFEAIQQGIVEN